MKTRCAVGAAAAVCSAAGWACAQNERLHFTYLWHLEQPVYWPDRQVGGGDRYETAWLSIQRKDAGASNPQNNLREIFGLDDRRAAYQFRVRDAVGAISGAPEAGAQVSYSGGLIENVSSLGAAGQLGYSANWFDPFRQARGWLTATANPRPRLDVVLFSFHHALLPLCDESTVRKEIQLYKAVYADAWGTGGTVSRGFFPSEMAFSTRMIGALAAEGVQWVLVSGEHVSRACADFPVVYGSGGINTDPPNRADQLNPAQGAANYFRLSIDRGCAPAEAYPYAFTPRRARHVDPATGAVSSVVVVPCSQSLGWKDGYAPMGTGFFDTLQTRNDPARPMLVVLAHDGDNAWGGGYSYYMEATPNLVSSARAQGYVPTVVEKYLADHPVPANDFVHVEDGAWVNADGDFGSPQFINWNWPLVSSGGQIDLSNGWHVDPRNWAVITAAQNRVDTAEQVVTRPGGPQAGGLNVRRILYPDANTTAAERAWHYFLGALNSGYMYYGTALDLEVKPTIACNEAVRLADQVLAGNGALDATPPTVFLPQRSHWNPGSVNFGPQHGYRQVVNNGDFVVSTFAYDVSGVASVNLKFRIDADGARSLSNTENETYAGGPGVGAWQTVAMTRRAFPAGNVHNDPDINFSEMPQYIAEHFSTPVTGLRSVLIDYYVEATDTRGNVKRSPIQHVYVGDGVGGTPGGGGGGGTPRVTLTPATPVAGEPVTVAYQSIGGPLLNSGMVRIHYGINGWTQIPSPDPQMSAGSPAGVWYATLTVPPTATVLDMAFNNGAGVWDNNGGQDWHFAVQPGTPAPPPYVMDGVLDDGTVAVATNGPLQLRAGLRGDVLYIAAADAGEGNDHFIFLAQTPGAPRAAPWAKGGQVAGWDAFLADENDNNYSGWFDAGAGVTTANGTGANGGWLEGTINLAQKYSALPSRVHLAFGAFPTANGAALVPGSQVPATVNGNGTLDGAEFVEVELCALLPGGCPQPPACPADFDQSGTVDTDDLADFIAGFFAAPPLPSTDFDNSGGIDPDDLADYIAAYFVGCP